MEIEIRPGTLSTALMVSVILALTVIGYQASPRDEDGRPVLLMPDVRAVEMYRRGAVRWVGEWWALHAELEQVLSDDSRPLLASSRQAQRAFDRAVALAREVDRTNAPSTLLGLQELAVSTSRGYIEASAAIARWLSVPSDENQAAAQGALASAHAALQALESNEWIDLPGEERTE